MEDNVSMTTSDLFVIGSLTPFPESVTASDSMQSVKLPSAPDSPISEPPSKDEKLASSTRWLAWVVLIIAASGVMCLLFKKRFFRPGGNGRSPK